MVNFRLGLSHGRIANPTVLKLTLIDFQTVNCSFAHKCRHCLPYDRTDNSGKCQKVRAALPRNANGTCGPA